MEIKPQPGPQTRFLSSTADVCILGGAAGGGKTMALILEPLRHFENTRFQGVIFRENSPQITNPGGLWDESAKLYSEIGAKATLNNLTWRFPMGGKIKFGHLEDEKAKYNWQGSQMAFIGFDEVTHFSEATFWYMFSRLRSVSGIPGYVRATCNPDPDSFIAKLISWWIDDNGYPIPERSGVLRYFVREYNKTKFYSSREECLKANPDDLPKSLTFIFASLSDNKILKEKDPSYESNLKALPYIDRMRLLEGNWKIRATAGTFFKKSFFEIVDACPAKVSSIRFWDRAGTKKLKHNKPDFTVGLKLTRDSYGLFYVEHIERFQEDPSQVMKRIKNTATIDSVHTIVGFEQDPGQAGKFEIDMYSKELAGFDIRVVRPSENKQVRARPASAQAERGNIKVLLGNWNDDFLDELESFPTGVHDDQVDTLSGAINLLTELGIGELNQSFSPDLTTSELKW